MAKLGCEGNEEGDSSEEVLWDMQEGTTAFWPSFLLSKIALLKKDMTTNGKVRLWR